MSTISTTIDHGITLSTSGSYASPLTITGSGAVVNGGTGDAVYGANTQAWTVFNQGRVTVGGSSGDGIDFKAGGYVSNGGSISAPIGVNISGGTGTILNSSTIFGGNGSGTYGRGIDLGFGGYVSNAAGGLIAGDAIAIADGSNDTIINNATIASSGTGSTAIDIGSGTLVNTGLVANARLINSLPGYGVTMQQGGLVDNRGTIAVGNYDNAVEIGGTTGTVINSGSIIVPTRSSAFSQGVGVRLSAGGTITNQQGGYIRGAAQVSGAGTVVDAGLILNTNGGGASVGDGYVSISAGGAITVAGANAVAVGISQGLVVNRGSLSSSGVGVSVDVKATILNYGSIVSRNDADYGINLGAGAVSNAQGGYIGGIVVQVGGTVLDAGIIARTAGDGILLKSPPGYIGIAPTAMVSGIVGIVGGGTIVDAGTVAGSGGAAIRFGGGGGNRLVVENGYALVGTVAGSTTVGATNTLELSGSLGAVTVNYNGLSLTNFQDVLFGPGGNEVLQVSNTSGTLPPTISGFVTNTETIDLTRIGANGTIAGTANQQLTIVGSGGTVTLKLDASDGSQFTTQPDGPNGTDVIACYGRGTRIRTEAGEVAIEELAIEDLVVTLSGALRPVKWIGRRSYDGRFIRRNPDALPVVVTAGALGDGVPARDLHLSPKHALFVAGVLVPAECLVDGVSVVRCPEVERVDYFHIELDSHDMIFAEGAPAETFVDCDSRGMFHNAQEYAELYPGEASPRWAFCAPRVEDGPALAAVRRRLDRRRGRGRFDREVERLLGRAVAAEVTSAETAAALDPAIGFVLRQAERLIRRRAALAAGGSAVADRRQVS